MHLPTIDATYAISALDGRYADQLEGLGKIVGEGGLIRYRIMTESAWLLHLASLPSKFIVMDPPCREFVEALAAGQIPEGAVAAVKQLEAKTNHDVKAVEYWLREQLTLRGANQGVLSHVHFACTSEDINNVAYALMLVDLRKTVVLPLLTQIEQTLQKMSYELRATPMLSRTHGQAASPTTMGKELKVTHWRISRQIAALSNQVILAKFNGAVGNYNAHVAAYPEMDWLKISAAFIEKRLGLSWNPWTTQIESHDAFVEFMSSIRHCNTILIDFSRDMWGYISLGYFAQRAVAGEVGSSTMPHKVNPIYFENAEGNLGVASSLISHFADKLPISRWQRDLSDSTVLRVTGTALGHALLGWKSLLKGLNRVAADPDKMMDDLGKAWEVLAEPVQTVMRRYGVTDAYERLKEATRGAPVVTEEMIHRVIDACVEVPLQERERMKAWRPEDYLGLATELSIMPHDKFLDAK